MHGMALSGLITGIIATALAVFSVVSSFFIPPVSDAEMQALIDEWLRIYEESLNGANGGEVALRV
jgi:hypothetical protein